MDVVTGLVVAASVVGVAAAIAWFARSRRSQEVRDTAALEAAVSRNVHVPPSLHPVIDPDLCIGSLSCLKACPEGDILGVVDGAARLIHGSNCIGHGRCAVECPVGAIRLVFGTSERGVDLPEIDEAFESSRSGVHIVGELGGMGLIKNAIVQGVQAAEFLAARLTAKARAGAAEVVDVVIVGAGPAGLATALGCRAGGLTFRVLDQGSVGGTVAQYPRQKVVMTETVRLPLFGKFGKRLISKEELLETFVKVCEKGDIRVEEGVKVVGLEGQDGAFVLQTSQGPVGARKVVLAVGRRGSPRKLGAPGEELEKVTYRLIDAEQYMGCRVLVVGGGDAGLEAAIQLAEESDAQVCLSHRGAAPTGREANKQRLADQVARGRIRLLVDSAVTEIRSDAVTLDHAGAVVELPNDYLIVCVGGELPLDFLKKMGIDVRRYHGTERTAPRSEGGPIALGALPRTGAGEGAPAVAKAARGSAKQEAARRHRRLAWGLFALGAIILAVLAWVGRDYYVMPFKGRLRSPLHASLKPAGAWGHGVGLVATGFMLSNFLYAVRKRWRLLKGTAPISTWLTFHVFVGFMSPLVILFHAAFQSNNMLATGTFLSVLVVVITGIVGRYIYGIVPSQGGSALEYAEVQGQFERVKARLGPLLEELADPKPLKLLFAAAAAPPHADSLAVALARRPFDTLALRLSLGRAHRQFPDWEHFREFRASLLRLVQLRDQLRFYRSLKKLLAGWRAFHAVLAIFLVLMIAAHIAVSLFLGYRWIFN